MVVLLERTNRNKCALRMLYSQPFEILSPKDHIHVTPLVAEEDSKLLENVDIVAKKPVYEQQIDRLVVNVDKSITSAGSTALDVLERSPGVIANRQNKTVSLGGKEGVVRMINGKETQMPLTSAIEMLSSMSSENIKKIELITTPPSNKYFCFEIRLFPELRKGYQI